MLWFIQVIQYCKGRQIEKIMMDWACGMDGKDKKYVHNFGGETSWKSPMWKMKVPGGYY
jgi:hypothetical protein